MKKLFPILAILSILFIFVTPVHAGNPVYVYYAGPQDAVRAALDVSVTTKEYAVTFTDDPTQAGVFVLNGIIPDDPRIAQRIQAGEAGLVLFLGPDVTQEQVRALLGYPLTLERKDDAVSLTEIKGLNDPLTTEVIWNGAP
jgi:hypothetical protein